MNIIQAVGSGKRFRRKGNDSWYENDGNTNGLRVYHFGMDDILSAEWETESVAITINEEQFDAAVANVANAMTREGGQIDGSSFLINLKRELGL
jgi:hypothetical protein